jgi:hypothetical protein
MKKITHLLWLAAVALTSPISYAGTHCSAISEQVSNAFTDINNVISSEEKAQLELLDRCSKAHNVCVTVQATAPTWFSIIEANSLAEIRVKKLNDRYAVSSLISIPMANDSGRCILTRFSGGTALAWVIDGWEVAGKNVRTLNTDYVQLHGETKSPAEITRESEQAGKKLR